MKKNSEYGKVLSSIYSAGKWNSFSEEITEPLLNKVAEFNSEIVDCLDLACGQGVLIEKMMSIGINAMGMDLSIYMLMKNQKLYGSRIFWGDMRTTCFNKKFDLVTCIFNSINHLANVEELEETFRNAERHLRKNGIFFFDVLKNNIKNYERHVVVKINNSIYDEEIKIDNQIVNTEFYENNSMQPIESIREYIYSESTIYECANKVGMVIMWRGDYLPDFINKFQQRSYFILMKIERN